MVGMLLNVMPSGGCLATWLLPTLPGLCTDGLDSQNNMRRCYWALHWKPFPS